jgi:hypothetical protein
VGFPPPAPFEVVHDVRSTTWIDERLMRRDRRSPGWVVGQILPSGFDAYARIFHRVLEVVRATRTETEWVTVRWAEIAERLGKVAHPRMQIESLIDHRDVFDNEHWKSISWRGQLFPPYEWLEDVECLALADVLREHTSATASAWFWLWDGYGDMGDEIRDVSRAMIGPGPTMRLPGTSPPVVAQLAFRHYLVFRGPLAGLSTWFGWREESPNYWYPDDRAWVVVTEIDGFSTFVGGTRSCIDAVLASSLLESMPCSLADRLDIGSDDINGDPRPPRS